MNEDTNQPDPSLPTPRDTGSTPVPNDIPELSPEDAAGLEALARKTLADVGIPVGDDAKPQEVPAPPPAPKPEELAGLEQMARSALKEAGVSISGPAQIPGAEPGNVAGVPQDRTWEQIQQQFAPQAPQPIEIRGWDELITRLDKIDDKLESIDQQLMRISQ